MSSPYPLTKPAGMKDCKRVPSRLPIESGMPTVNHDLDDEPPNQKATVEENLFLQPMSSSWPERCQVACLSREVRTRSISSVWSNSLKNKMINRSKEFVLEHVEKILPCSRPRRCWRLTQSTHRGAVDASSTNSSPLCPSHSFEGCSASKRCLAFDTKKTSELWLWTNSPWFSVQWYLPLENPSWFLSHSEVVHGGSIRIQCTFASPSPPAKASVPPPAFDHHNVVVLRSRRRGRSVQTRPPRHPSFHLKNVGRKHLKRLKKLEMPSKPHIKGYRNHQIKSNFYFSQIIFAQRHTAKALKRS